MNKLMGGRKIILLVGAGFFIGVFGSWFFK
jgi:hypothetical protein